MPLHYTRSGYTFSPPSLQVSVNGSSVFNRNFTANPNRYAVSGSAGVTGARVSISGIGVSETVTAGGGGSFSFTPVLIDTSASSQDVTVTLGITDDLAGVPAECCPGVEVFFESPAAFACAPANGPPAGRTERSP